jgi:hypothetical protein
MAAVIGKHTTPTMGVNLDDVATDAIFALGTRVQAENGQEYVYVQASGAITLGDAVGVDEAFQAAALTAAMVADGWSIAFAQIAAADNEHLFVATRGHQLTCRFAAAQPVDTALGTGSVAGTLHTITVGGTSIKGVVAVTSVTGAGTTEILATFPRSAAF